MQMISKCYSEDKREITMKPSLFLKCYVLSNTIYCEYEYWKLEFLKGRWNFSCANQSHKEKQSGNNADAVLNDFTDLESESAK